MLKAKNFEWWSIFAELSRIFYQKYLKEYWLKLIIGKYSIIRLFLEGVIDTKLPFWGNFEFTLTSTENQGEKSCEIHIQQTRLLLLPNFKFFDHLACIHTEQFFWLFQVISGDVRKYITGSLLSCFNWQQSLDEKKDLCEGLVYMNYDFSEFLSEKSRSEIIEIVISQRTLTELNCTLFYIKNWVDFSQEFK